MKEATGELNMTVVTLIAVAALGAVFYFAVWPLVQRMLIDRTCQTYGTDYHAERVGNAENVQNGQAKTYKWMCCPAGVSSGDTCIGVDE